LSRSTTPRGPKRAGSPWRRTATGDAVPLTSYLLGNGTPELRGGADTTRLAENVSDAEETVSQVLGDSPSVFPVNCRVVEATRQRS
jgi:hypothetical protein